MFSLKRTLFLFGLFLLVAPLSVNGQATSGIGLSPSLIEEGADPGALLERAISVTNLSDTEQTYYLFTRDISTVSDGGVPVYAKEGTERTGYELTDWISLGVEEVTLLPGQEQDIDVTIDIPDSATPGSHFGAVFISMQPPRLRQVGAAVGYEVANIISIRISGDVTESAQIRSFRTDNLIYGNTEVEFMAEIENKGNVLIRPYGPLEIYNMFGKRVAIMNLNDSQGGVFPFTKRAFNITWEDEGVGFGRYQATLAMVYGDPGRQATMSNTVSFWILPMNIITPALIILAILLLAAYLGVRMYVKRSIASMGGTRRLVRHRRQRGGTSTLLIVALVMLAVTALFLIVLLALFA